MGTLGPIFPHRSELQNCPPLRNAVIFLALLGILFALASISLHLLDTDNIGVDDANIFFVYAKNLAEGNGLVYNTGGERVEGFSSLLWTLLLGVIYKLPGNPEPTILFVNLVFMASALTALISFGGKWMVQRTGQPVQPLLGIGGFLLLAWSLASPSLVIWTTISLMENGLWTAVAIFATLLMLEHSDEDLPPFRTRLFFSILLVMVILSRPEGMLWAAVLGLGSFVGIWLRGGGLLRSFKAVFLPALACLFTVGGLFTFRLYYFGYPFPNTYYAKVSPDRFYNLLEGGKYLVHFQLSNWLVPLFTLVAIFGAWKLCRCVIWRMRSASLQMRGETPSDITVGLLSVVLLVGGSIPVLVGGDHFSMFRFYQVVWPLLPLPLFLMIGPILSQRINLPWSWRVAIPALGLVLFVILPADAWFRLSSSHRIRSEFTIVERDSALGVLLNRTFAANERPSLGVVAAGAIALAYEGEVIDMMGLNNSIMAHAAGDRKGRKNHAAFNKDILLQQSPEIIAAGEISSPETFAADHKKQMAYLEQHPSEDVLKGLRNEDRFLKTYELGFIEVDGGKLVGGWFLKSYIPKLRALRYRPVAY